MDKFTAKRPIGFVTSWMQQTAGTVENNVETVPNENEDLKISETHADLRAVISDMEDQIISSAFGRMRKELKVNFLEQLDFFKAIETELTAKTLMLEANDLLTGVNEIS